LVTALTLIPVRAKRNGRTDFVYIFDGRKAVLGTVENRFTAEAQRVGRKAKAKDKHRAHGVGAKDAENGPSNSSEI
jgi:hypothetical protein